MNKNKFAIEVIERKILFKWGKIKDEK